MKNPYSESFYLKDHPDYLTFKKANPSDVEKVWKAFNKAARKAEVAKEEIIGDTKMSQRNEGVRFLNGQTSFEY